MRATSRQFFLYSFLVLDVLGWRHAEKHWRLGILRAKSVNSRHFLVTQFKVEDGQVTLHVGWVASTFDSAYQVKFL